jgi:ribosome maturation factor RimP
LKPTNLEQVKKELTKLAESQSLRFFGAAFAREAHGRVLRLTIDTQDAAKQVTLDDCERFHKAAVDIVENIEYDYLECSSRGADRALETDEDLNEAIGSVVDVRLYKPIRQDPPLGKRFSGTLAGCVGTPCASVIIEIDSQKTEISRKEISAIKLHVEVPL